MGIRVFARCSLASSTSAGLVFGYCRLRDKHDERNWGGNQVISKAWAAYLQCLHAPSQEPIIIGSKVAPFGGYLIGS